MYLLWALLGGFLPVFGSALIGSLFDRRDRFATLLVGTLAGLAWGAIVLWIMWGTADGMYGPTPLFWQITIGAFLGALIAGVSSESVAISALPGVAIGGLYLLYACFAAVFGSSDMLNAKEKAAIIGTVNVVEDIETVLQPADPAHICLVSESMARATANEALSQFVVDGGVVPGSRYKIGVPTKQFVGGSLMWIFPLEFQGWLKWRQFKVVPGYLRVSAENPYAKGQPVQVNAIGNSIEIRYLNSACFEYRADRYLREQGYMDRILSDWTFEVDDEWNPYYTVSILERTIGYGGYRTVGVVTLDLRSGDHKLHPMDNLPSWIDRAVPIDVIDTNLKKWGMYALEGWWYNFWHDDKAQEPTPGWYLTYNGDACQWFSGFTSTNADDQALTGFTLVGARDMGVAFFKASGVTEAMAYSTARSHWSNFDGYTPTDLTPYNIEGRLTYVIPVEYSRQFKGVSLVSLSKKDINARGDTFEQALARYRAAIVRGGADREIPAGGELASLVYHGHVSRVGTPIVVGDQQVFPFTVEGMAKIFHAPLTFDTPKVPFVQPGDSVVIGYLDTEQWVITCQTFDIPSIALTDENPTQARYFENQEVVRPEVDRVEDATKRRQLSESDRLKQVDPDELARFLREQETTAVVEE